MSDLPKFKITRVPQDDDESPSDLFGNQRDSIPMVPTTSGWSKRPPGDDDPPREVLRDRGGPLIERLPSNPPPYEQDDPLSNGRCSSVWFCLPYF